MKGDPRRGSHLANIGGVAVYETTIDVPEFARRDLAALGEVFAQVEHYRSGFKWARGELLVLAEEAEGVGAWAQWIDEGAPRWSLIHELRVSRAFREGQRWPRPLSWSHHYEVLPLPLDARAEVLEVAHRDAMSVRLLREFVQGFAAVRDVEAAVGMAATENPDDLDPNDTPLCDYIVARAAAMTGRRVDPLLVSAILAARDEWERARDRVRLR